MRRPTALVRKPLTLDEYFAGRMISDPLCLYDFTLETDGAVAAVVTARIGLSTAVLLGPLRVNAAALAKQALSLHALSGGRLTLGIGLGARGDDYELAGVAGHRGKELEAMLARIKELWEGDVVGPAPCVGADNDFVFRDLVGLSEAEYASYRQQGVFD